MNMLELIQSLSDDNPCIRNAAVLELQFNGSEEIVEEVVKLCSAPNYKLREASAAVLGFVNIQDSAKLRLATTCLTALALGDKSLRVRRSAISSLGGRYSKSPSVRRYILPVLVETAKDTSASIRLSTSEALSNVRSKIAAPLIEKLLQDTDKYVRDWTAFYLQFTNLDSKCIREGLLLMLQDEYDDARIEAIYALVNLKDRRVVPALKDELENDSVILKMLEAAGDIGDVALLPTLEGIVASFKGDGDEGERIAKKQYQRLLRKTQRQRRNLKN